jgi:serine/threonine protein kinase
MANRIGQQFGKYRLVRLLGKGNFSEVYLGQHVSLKSEAAIKVLNTHVTNENEGSFLNEAQTVARLVHPHIIRIFDFDEEAGVPFLVMDYAPNGTLRRRHPPGQIIPLPVIILSYDATLALLSACSNSMLVDDHKLVRQCKQTAHSLHGTNVGVNLGYRLSSKQGPALTQRSSARIDKNHGFLPYSGG